MDLNHRTPGLGQLAAKVLVTSAVELLAHRPEKKRRRGSSVPLQLAVKLAPAKVEFGLNSVPASVLLACREGDDVRFAGTEKIQKVQPGVFARLAHTQEDEVFFNSFRCRKTFDGTAEPSKSFDRVLGVVVVPRDTIVA
jgi:hypothetical protein